MKIILAGNWVWPIYQETCSNSLKELGIEVIPFKWNSYFSGILGKFEAHTLINISRQKKLNNDLVNLCDCVKPDILFVWSAMHIQNETLQKIRGMGIVLVSYNNDDPFAKRYSDLRYYHLRKIWRNFKKNLPEYDINFVYRKKNIIDYQNIGVANAILLRSYYSPEHNFPLNLERGKEYDGVFIGHYETDERFSCIKSLQNKGIPTKIFGSGWDKCQEDGIDKYGKIHPVIGPDYNLAINKAKFALCFFSKLNNDEYTRRVFEIPATKTLLVSKRTPEMKLLYKDGEEAIFFDDEDELVTRLQYLMNRPEELLRIAQNGYRRCTSSGYHVQGRMKKMLSDISPFLDKRK